MNNSPTWLTQEAYDRLKAELDNLINVERSAIAKKIQDAREEGDLKENGGYHAAKDQQGIIEARIARLNQILANSVIGESQESSDTVSQGMVITIDLNGKQMEFLLGSAEMAENTDLTVYSPDSPMGNAIIGAK
ncbi:MAG: transcription elongation factor GreA, partial [Micrococcales bacterium]|nr:transcription elongation factor GreA [Micrococcales bacterium]